MDARDLPVKFFSLKPNLCAVLVRRRATTLLLIKTAPKLCVLFDPCVCDPCVSVYYFDVVFIDLFMVTCVCTWCIDTEYGILN